MHLYKIYAVGNSSQKYGGKVDTTYTLEVAPKTLKSDVTAKISSSKTYLPDLNSLSLTVKFGSNTLEAGKDYKIVGGKYFKYSDLTKTDYYTSTSTLTQAYVELEGIGNYSEKARFLITANGASFTKNAKIPNLLRDWGKII